MWLSMVMKGHQTLHSCDSIGTYSFEMQSSTNASMLKYYDMESLISEQGFTR